jgi:hypothetical protein
MILRTVIVIHCENQLKEINILSKRNSDFWKDRPGCTIITTLHERIKQQVYSNYCMGASVQSYRQRCSLIHAKFFLGQTA